MQRALCNETAEQEDSEHVHICNLDYGHKTSVHFCRCGAFFMIVKDSAVQAELKKKVQ